MTNAAAAAAPTAARGPMPNQVSAAPAPYIATYLSKTYGLAYAGYYLSAVGLVTLLALALIKERKEGGR